MNVYRFTFPINNYEGDGVFEKHVYFTGTRCPNHDEVVERLVCLASDENRMSLDPAIAGPHCREYLQCLDAIKFTGAGELAAKKLPFLVGNLVGKNEFCIHPKWGMQPISVNKISLHEFEKPFVSWYDGGTEY